jgi:hypothetical protein
MSINVPPLKMSAASRNAKSDGMACDLVGEALLPDADEFGTTRLESLTHRR